MSAANRALRPGAARRSALSPRRRSLAAGAEASDLMRSALRLLSEEGGTYAHAEGLLREALRSVGVMRDLLWQDEEDPCNKEGK